MRTMIRFYTLVAAVVLAGITLGAQEKRTDPSCERVVEQRIQEGLKWVEDNPWPTNGVEWKLRHAYLVAARKQEPGPLNKIIQEYCEAYKLDPKAKPTAYHDPRPDPILYRLYLKPTCHRLLSPEARNAIADVCWRWVYRHSFIGKNQKWPLNNPTKSAWIISGSENHCAAQRSANLLALQVLLKTDNLYGAKAELYDGFTVGEHYEEWVKWYCMFFLQRIREGLTCEVAHPSSYGNATISHCYEIEDLTDSPDLKKAAGDFLTMFWANVASEFEPRTGIRASVASTRNYKWSWNQSGEIYWARSLLYAYGWTDVESKPNLTHLSLFISDYRPPAILRAIASDTDRGPYMGTSRRFGRGTGWDNGIYQVLFDDGTARNSYIRRDTWYSRAYTMSALSLDPGRDYIELVDQSRVMGVTFANDIDDRLIVYAGNTPAVKKIEYKMPTSNGVNGMLGPNCLIVARDPNANAKKSNSTRIFISDGALWDNRDVADGGWFFTRAGEGYAAFRIAGEKEYSVDPSPYGNGYYLELRDIWAPVVIQMGEARNHKNSFAAFKKAVKTQSFIYDDGKLTYTALSGDTYEYWGNSKTLPTINGKTLDLNPPRTYDFPYLTMGHGESKAVIRYPGYKDLIVDLTKK